MERKERNKRQSQTNEENSSTNTEKKEKYEESLVCRFKQAWNEEFPWVEFDEVKN